MSWNLSHTLTHFNRQVSEQSFGVTLRKKIKKNHKVTIHAVPKYLEGKSCKDVCVHQNETFAIVNLHFYPDLKHDIWYSVFLVQDCIGPVITNCDSNNVLVQFCSHPVTFCERKIHMQIPKNSIKETH